jgi:hypothetical protein
MHRSLSLSLVFVLSACVASGCVIPEEGSGFERGGERQPEPEVLPVWGTDNCGTPGAPGSPWSGPIALDWRLEDPFGRDVRLHQFCGRVILLESIRSDVSDLESRLLQLEEFRAEFASWELAVVVLIATADGSEPERETLARMTLELDLSFPLLADPGWLVTSRYAEPTSYDRSIQLYSPGLALEATGLLDVDVSDIDALLPEGGVS